MAKTLAVSRAALLWIGGVLAALLVVLIVLVSVLLTTMNDRAEAEDYQACMAQMGYANNAPPALGDRTEDEFIDDIAAAAEYCSD